MSEVVKPDGTTELVECLDILMEALDGLTEQGEVLVADDEFETALWQTTQLAMTLLFDNLGMQQLLNDIAAEQDERDKVGQIIRPQLVVPDHIVP